MNAFSWKFLVVVLGAYAFQSLLFTNVVDPGLTKIGVLKPPEQRQ